MVSFGGVGRSFPRRQLVDSILTIARVGVAAAAAVFALRLLRVHRCSFSPSTRRSTPARRRCSTPTQHPIATIAADGARPCRSADAADRAVMTRGGHPFSELDRIAVTVGPGSFTGLRVGVAAARGIALAAEKPVVGLTTLSAFAAPCRREAATAGRSSPIDARHDHVYFQLVGGDGAIAVRRAVAPIADVLRHRRARRAASVGNCRTTRSPSAGPPSALAPARSIRSAAPDISWVAWLGAAADPGPRRRGRCICARPTPNRSDGRQALSRAAIRHEAGCPASRRAARPRSSRRSHARRRSSSQLHGASFHRGWSEGEFEADAGRAQHAGARAAAGRTPIGFIISRMAADEAEILSVAVDRPSRGRGWSRELLLTHLGHLAGYGIRAIFLEVEENNEAGVAALRTAGFRASRPPRTAIISVPVATN